MEESHQRQEYLRRVGYCSFAASLGGDLRKWYRIVYASDSSFVHQTDITTYLAPIEDGNFTPRLYTSVKQVLGVLHRSSILYLGCIIELNKRFKFGNDASASIDTFSQRLNGWNA